MYTKRVLARGGVSKFTKSERTHFMDDTFRDIVQYFAVVKKIFTGLSLKNKKMGSKFFAKPFSVR